MGPLRWPLNASASSVRSVIDRIKRLIKSNTSRLTREQLLALEEVGYALYDWAYHRRMDLPEKPKEGKNA